jgi:hypothetical protein
MNQKLLEMAKVLGIETKGKTELELMNEISDGWGKEQANIETSNLTASIENGAKQLPAIKKQFENPIEIWLEKVQNGKKPECLQVVGYNPKTSSVIITKKVKSTKGGYSYKIYQIEEQLVIKSAKQLNEIKARLKAERAEARENPTPKKPKKSKN